MHICNLETKSIVCMHDFFTKNMGCVNTMNIVNGLWILSTTLRIAEFNAYFYEQGRGKYKENDLKTHFSDSASRSSKIWIIFVSQNTSANLSKFIICI